ncbi:hypothetical protein TWF694_010497 [Orbilia ellipsospora]|uniref:Uncharacterized protein n=1 Tax=Orbilia ellipsospora TaxID=2528407 RepID=A0AAV9XB79_9PEZI
MQFFSKALLVSILAVGAIAQTNDTETTTPSNSTTSTGSGTETGSNSTVTGVPPPAFTGGAASLKVSGAAAVVLFSIALAL